MTNGKKVTAWLALLFIVAVTGLSSPAAAGGAMDQLGVKSTGSKAPAPAPDYGGSSSTGIPWRHMSRDCKGDKQCLAYTGAFRCMTEGARCYDFKAVSAACGLSAYTSQPLKPAPGNFDEGDGYTGIARYDLFFGNKGTAQPNWEKLPPKVQGCVLGQVQRSYVPARVQKLSALAAKFRNQWAYTSSGKLTNVLDSLRARLLASGFTDKTMYAWYNESCSEVSLGSLNIDGVGGSKAQKDACITYNKYTLLTGIISDIDNKPHDAGLSYHENCVLHGKKCCDNKLTPIFNVEGHLNNEFIPFALDRGYITGLDETIKNMTVEACKTAGSKVVGPALKPGADFRVIPEEKLKDLAEGNAEESKTLEHFKTTVAGASLIIGVAGKLELLEHLPGGQFLEVGMSAVELALLPSEMSETVRQVNEGKLQVPSVASIFWNADSPVAAVTAVARAETAVAALANKCNNLMVTCFEDPDDCRCNQLCSYSGCFTKRLSWLNCENLMWGNCH